MWLHPADFVQLDPPISQRWIGRELCESVIVDGLNFGSDKRCRFANLRQQILDLPNSRKVFRACTVLRELKRGEVTKPFDLHLERFLQLEAIGQTLRGFAHAAVPFLQARISLLDPAEILLPFAHIGEEMRQVPLVRFRNLGASWNRGGHQKTSNAQRRTSNSEFTRGRSSIRCPAFSV